MLVLQERIVSLKDFWSINHTSAKYLKQAIASVKLYN